MPVRLGIAGSLEMARLAHGFMLVLLLGFGLISHLHVPYYLGLAIILVCVVVQHALARRQDPVSLNTAFFRMNAVISAMFLVAVVTDVVLP